jgi:hypothetical protein
MSRSDGSKPPAVEHDAFALQSVAWEAAIGATEQRGTVKFSRLERV